MLPDKASPEKWRSFLHQCLARRVDVDEFKDLSKLMRTRSPVSEDELLDLLLEVRGASTITWDPLLPVYVDGLCKAGQVKPSAALSSLLKHSSVRNKENGRKISTLMTDIKVIQDVSFVISTGSIPRTANEAAELYSVTVEWVFAVSMWHNSLDPSQQVGGMMNSPDVVSLIEALGVLLVALSGAPKGLEVLSSDSQRGAEKDLKERLGQALSTYIPLSVDSFVRQRLDQFQKQFTLYGEQPSKSMDHSIEGMNVNALQFEASVMNGPVINTRAGLYMYLNSLLVGRPLVDDSMLLNYLTNRYEGHQEILVEEIITAAFDVLSNGVNRNESSRTMFLFRSFLVNKLPAFFAAMTAAAMVPINVEMCVSQALSRLDPNAFPSFSQMFSMQGNSILSDARQEFLFACASHRLIPESSIERLLGENPMQTLPVGGPYQKDDLVSQINNNPERADQLIGEIESMEGNAGAIVGAILEVCLIHDQVPLRSLTNCNRSCSTFVIPEKPSH